MSRGSLGDASFPCTKTRGRKVASESRAYPIAAVRALVEQAAHDDSVPVSLRIRELEMVRDELTALLGECATRIADWSWRPMVPRNRRRYRRPGTALTFGRP